MEVDVKEEEKADKKAPTEEKANIEAPTEEKANIEAPTEEKAIIEASTEEKAPKAESIEVKKEDQTEQVVHFCSLNKKNSLKKRELRTLKNELGVFLIGSHQC